MTTKTFNGAIKSITFKPLPSADAYGNMFRIWMTLEDGSVINMGNTKKEQFSIKEGKEYYNLQVGDVIFLKYEDTGKFKNSKSANLTLVTKASEVVGLSYEQSSPHSGKATAKPQEASKNNDIATPASNQGQPVAPQQNVTAQPFKVYGEIKGIQEGVAVVANEDGKDYKVVLGNFSNGLVVGMRITAKIDKEGNIVSGFKSYPLKASAQSTTDKISSVPDDSFSSKERQFKMSFGNMMNVAANTNLVEPQDIAKFAIELFQPAADLRVKLINQFKDSRSDNDVGAKLGDALKQAAKVHNNSVQGIISYAEKYVIEHIKAEEYKKSVLEGKSVVKPEEKVIQQESAVVQSTTTNVEPDFSEPPVDFDEQIPF